MYVDLGAFRGRVWLFFLLDEQTSAALGKKCERCFLDFLVGAALQLQSSPVLLDLIPAQIATTSPELSIVAVSRLSFFIKTRQDKTRQR